jgi:hypothetical protein
LLADLTQTLLDQPVPSSYLAEKRDEKTGQNTVRDLFDYYQAPLWQTIVDSEQAYRASLPVETKQQDVKERFNFDTWYDGFVQQHRRDLEDSGK